MERGIPSLKSETVGTYPAQRFSRRQALEEGVGAAEPGALAAAEVAGNGGLLVEDFAGPLAGFGVAAFGGEQLGKVQVGLR